MQRTQSHLGWLGTREKDKFTYNYSVSNFLNGSLQVVIAVSVVTSSSAVIQSKKTFPTKQKARVSRN